MSSHEVVHGDVAYAALTLKGQNRDLLFNCVRGRKEIKRTGPQMLIAIAIFVSVTALFTQDRQKPAYLSLDLPAQQRAEVFIRRMTVEEKVTQLVNESRAIPKLSLAASHPGYWQRQTAGSSRTTEWRLRPADPPAM